MNFQRPQIKTLSARLNEKRKFIQVIAGPRQVGKTTLVSQYLEISRKEFHFVSADAQNSNGVVWIEQQWQTARLKLKQSKRKVILLVIDEVQKITDWSEKVKQLWDEDTRLKINIKVVLLGSSRLLLKKGLSESLAGRFEYINLGHWSYKEINSAFSITPEEYAWFGGYPGSIDLLKDEKRWKEYIYSSIIEATISKDILMQSVVYKPALLKNLFELGCLYSGQILSLNKILGQLSDAGNTTTLAHYLDLLNSAGLISGIEKYTQNPIRKRKSSPKFQVYNTALISAQMNTSFNHILSASEKWGRIIESVIGSHLLNSRINNQYKIYYWRDGNNEVDFILERENQIIALEVKSISAKEHAGLNKFQKIYNPSKVILINEDSLTWKEFIKMDPLQLFDR